MNRGEIKSLSRSWLDDDDGGYFTDAVMDPFINQAQREVQKKLIQAGENYYDKLVETDTVVDQRDYAIPDDFMKLLRVERITQGSGDTAATERIYPMSRNEMDVAQYTARGASQGVPFNYILNQDTFSLLPVPNSTETIRLWYVYRVSDLTSDGETPDCPEDFHEYIAILAARDGFLRDGRTLAPIESKLMYYERLMDEISEDRTLDSPRMIVSTTDGFGAL